MPNYIKKLTKKQELAMPKYRDKWIEIGLRTGETDWKTFDKYMPICYEKAGLKYPKNVVRVSSPLVGGLASAIAEAILRKNSGAVRDAVGGAVSDAVDGAVDDAVRGAVRDAVGGAVRDAVRDAVSDAVRDAVDGAVDGAVSDAVSSAFGDAVRGAVDGAVRDAVDGAVSDAVGDAVRGAVSGAVGGAVDGAVGDAVGDAVRGAVSIIKKFGLSISWHYWLGGQFWVGGWYWGVSFVNFFFDVCKLKLSKDILERALAYRKVCESVNYIWPNRDFVMVCARPTKINRDERGRLHSDTEKAIKYPDGWGLYCLQGIKFEEKWWKKIVGDEMTPEEVFAIDNQEHRRIAYEYMDKAKMKTLKDFKILEEVKDDGFGYPMKIISFSVKNVNEPLIFLNCHCPTSGREYFIATKETNCQKAKMTSFGLSDNDKFNDEW